MTAVTKKGKVLVIDTSKPWPPEHAPKKSKPKLSTTKVIEVLDPKAIKHNIITSWQAYVDCPAKIVKTMKKCYPNLATASVQLSNLKSTLSELHPRPPEEFLQKLRLSRAEYKQLRDAYREKRDKESFDMTTIRNGDELLKTAMEGCCSSDFRVLFPSLAIVCGLRPVELLTVNIQLNPKDKHPYSEFWCCISGWAKKGQSKDKAKQDFCRDHPLLGVPSWLFIRGIKLCRDHFCKKPKTKRQLHQSYGKYWLGLLQKLLPNMIKPTYVTMRRFYAKMAVKYFIDQWPTAVNETSFTSYVLGHVSMEPALSYTNIRVQNAGKLKIFEIGRNLKPLATDKDHTSSSRSNESESANLHASKEYGKHRSSTDSHRTHRSSKSSASSVSSSRSSRHSSRSRHISRSSSSRHSTRLTSMGPK